jgi:hypothetical protein
LTTDGLAPIVHSVVFSNLKVPLGIGAQTEFDQDSMGLPDASDNVLMSATDRHILVGLLTYGFTVSPGGYPANYY